MPKRIKFPLIMKEGVPVRTIEELKENFDFEKVFEFYQNGKLLTWLEDRYYENEVEAIKELKVESNTFKKDLCNVFSVSYEVQKSVDLAAVQEKNRKIEYLKQFTDDQEILKSINQIALNQEDLYKLVTQKENLIYLCEGKYIIPLHITNKKYVGLGKVQVIIKHGTYAELQQKGMEFEKIELLDANEKPLITVKLEDAEQLYINYHIDEAVSMLQKLSKLNNGRAQFILGMIYIDGAGNIQYDFNEAMKYFEMGESNGDVLCKFRKALDSQAGIQSVYNELHEQLKREADSGNTVALYELGMYYLQNGENQNYSLMAEYFKKAADSGYWRACRSCGINYELGRGVTVDYAEAKKWYLKASCLGDKDATVRVGNLLIYRLNEIEEGIPYLKETYSSEIIKKQVHDIVNEVENIESKYLGQAPGVQIFISLIDVGKRFSSRSAAANYIDNQFAYYCREKNKTFESSNSRFVELKEYYVNESSKIIKKANLLIQIVATIREKSSLKIIESVDSAIITGLEKLLKEYQKTPQTSGYYFDPQQYIYDSTEHNGLFNTTKYWIDSSIGCDINSHVKYDNKAYSNEANNLVKSILREALISLQNLS